MNAVIELLQSHRSIRRFVDRPIEPGLLESLLRAGQGAATSSFLQGATVIRIADPGRRAKLAALAGDQPHVETAAEFLVFCADLKRAADCCARRGRPFEGGYTEHFIIAVVDVALMAQNVATAAESAGLGICYIGGIRNNPGPVSEMLELPAGVWPVFGLCLGWPDQDPRPKPRLPLPVVLKQEVYSDAGDAERIERYDEEVREHYRGRAGRAAPWSERVAELLSEKARPHMRDFLAGQGFVFK